VRAATAITAKTSKIRNTVNCHKRYQQLRHASRH
jgi:hypothetical protein